MTPASLPVVTLWTVVGLAAIWDVHQRRIPNKLVLVGLILGAAFQAQASGVAGLGLSALGAVVALAVLITPFALRVMGGGDVKLAMVCGAFLGWKGAIHVILAGAVIHGVLALMMLVLARLADMYGRDSKKLKQVPHAVGFAIATLAYSLGLFALF